jgi:hypothetical protein
MALAGRPIKEAPHDDDGCDFHLDSQFSCQGELTERRICPNVYPNGSGPLVRMPPWWGRFGFEAGWVVRFYRGSFESAQARVQDAFGPGFTNAIGVDLLADSAVQPPIRSVARRAF